MKHSFLSRGAGFFLMMAAAAMMGALPAAHADAYPSKPITLVVPFTPGGSTDILGRLVAAELKDRLNQSVVVENRSGANGNIGTASFARSAPDGYTLLMANAGTNAVNPSMYGNLGWDPIKSFTPLAMVARVDNVVVLSPSVPAGSMKELAELARVQPVNYGSAGIGSIFHLAGALFGKAAGVEMTHVPYKGANPALVDTISGRVQVMFATIPGALPFLRSGQVKAIGVTGKQRSSLFPDLPTAIESGFPDMVIDNWFAVFGPAGMPKGVEGKLIQAMTDMINDPAFQAKLREQGAEPGTLIGADLQRQLVEDIARWKDIVAAANVSIDQ